MEVDPPVKDTSGNVRPVEQEVDGAGAKPVAEITLDPNTVKLSPVKITEKGKCAVKSLSDPSAAPSRVNGKQILRKQFSQPTTLRDGIYRKNRNTTTFYDNPAFEADDAVPNNPTFADVVRQVINEPIAEDIHPFGRGHLYATALKLELPTIHQEEGSLFMWFLATAVVLGLVGAVIFMSIMYEPHSSPTTTTQRPSLNTT